jgi:hypothetical protein
MDNTVNEEVSYFDVKMAELKNLLASRLRGSSDTNKMVDDLVEYVGLVVRGWSANRSIDAASLPDTVVDFNYIKDCNGRDIGVEITDKDGLQQSCYYISDGNDYIGIMIQGKLITLL